MISGTLSRCEASVTWSVGSEILAGRTVTTVLLSYRFRFESRQQKTDLSIEGVTRGPNTFFRSVMRLSNDSVSAYSIG
jgi:hypothetical protein